MGKILSALFPSPYFSLLVFIIFNSPFPHQSFLSNSSKFCRKCWYWGPKINHKAATRRGENKSKLKRKLTLKVISRHSLAILSSFSGDFHRLGLLRAAAKFSRTNRYSERRLVTSKVFWRRKIFSGQVFKASPCFVRSVTRLSFILIDL